MATDGTPLKTTYHWLIDPGNTGTLSKRLANLPAVNFVLQAAPAPGAPQPVVAEIEAHKADGEIFGTPYWVKTFSKHVDHNVKLDDLVKHHVDVPGGAEVEVEFEIFQADDVKGKKDAALVLNPGDAALVVRYEFYRYVGAQIAGLNAVEPLVAVPEPGQSTLLALGLVGLAIGWRRRASSLGF